MSFFYEVQTDHKSEAQYNAYRRYRSIKKARLGIWALFEIPEDILTHMGISHSVLRDLNVKFAHSTKSLSRTFSICNTCNIAIRGRKLRKDSKPSNQYHCDICGAHDYPRYGPPIITIRRIHHTATLEATLAFAHENSPELFI